VRTEKRRQAKLDGGSSAISGRLVARTVHLLDRLRRSEIWPFMIQAESTNITQDVVTQMNTDDLKNESGAVLVVTRARVFSDTAKSTFTVIQPPATNVSLRLTDNDHMQSITKQPVNLPVLFARDTNTWALDRPHVISTRGSFSAYLTEEGSGSTTDVSLMLLGDVVAGDLTASEVQELIGLGLYPGVAGSAGGWARFLLYASLAEDVEDGVSEEVELAQLELRSRVSELRLRLARSRSRYTVLETSAANVPANGTVNLPSDRLRNDSGWPLLVTRMMMNTLGAPASTGTVAKPLTNLSADVSVLSGRKRKSLVWRPTVGALIVDADSNVWKLDQPMVLAPGDSVEIKAYEETGGGTIDMYVSLHGQLMEGMGAAELRECVALGLLDGWRAQRD